MNKRVCSIHFMFAEIKNQINANCFKLWIMFLNMIEFQIKQISTFIKMTKISKINQINEVFFKLEISIPICIVPTVII